MKLIDVGAAPSALNIDVHSGDTGTRILNVLRSSAVWIGLVDEVSCALELIDSALSDPSRSGDYRVLVAIGAGEKDDDVRGYICYGPTPMTQGTYDLYWLATDPAHRGQGIAGRLCQAMEEELRRAGGRLVRVETSTTDGYGAAQRFYSGHGYPEVARIADFYKPVDSGESWCVPRRSIEWRPEERLKASTARGIIDGLRFAVDCGCRRSRPR